MGAKRWHPKQQAAAYGLLWDVVGEMLGKGRVSPWDIAWALQAVRRGVLDLCRPRRKMLAPLGLTPHGGERAEPSTVGCRGQNRGEN